MTRAPMQPYLGVMGSLANLLLVLSEARGAMIGVFMLVDTDGLSPDVVAAAENWKYVAKNQFALHSQNISGVAVDMPARTAHGHTQPGSLDLHLFNAMLKANA
jgi:hypothetical protein